MKKIYFFLFLLITTGINAQWKYCSLPEGGMINDIIHTGTTLIAGSAYNGIYISTDNGIHWEQAKTSVKKAINVYKFTTQGSTIFAAGNGIFKSIDDGKNWTYLSDQMIPPYFRSLLVLGDTLYASTHQAIHRSFDMGVTWKNIPVINTAKPITFFSILSLGNTLLAATGNGLYESTDKGESWKATNSDFPPQHTISLARIGNTLFAMSTTNLYSSTDNGKSWNESRDGLPTPHTYLRSMSINNNSIYVTCSDGLYLSSDLGLHWSKTGKTPPIKSISASASHAGKLFIGTPNGVFSSDDNGSTWKSINKNIQAMEVFGLAQNATTIFAASIRGVFASDDEGSSWKPVYDNDHDSTYAGDACMAIVTNGNTIYAGKLNGVIVSTDNGSSWKHLDASPYWVNDLALSGSTIFAATDEGLFRSENEVTWTSVAPFVFANVYVYWVSVKGNIIYVGTSDGMYRSMDTGLSWTEINNGIPDNSYIGFIVNNNNEVFTGTWNAQTYHSTDYGHSWSPASVPDKTFFMDRVGNDLFANTKYGGLFVSTDNCKSWIDIQNGAPYAYSSRVLKRKDQVFVSTIGAGIWYRNADELPSGIIEQLSSSPLYIYPNPSNGIFNVISAYKNVTIEVINLLGACILKTQLDTPATIDLQGQPKGVYIVRIISRDGHIRNQKIVLE